MKTRTQIIIAGLAVVACPVLVAAQMPDGMAGTWKLNVARSTCSPGPCARAGRTVIEKTAGGGMKMLTDGVSAEGVASHRELVSRFDGSEAEVKGSEPLETRAYIRVNERAYEWVARVGGKVTSKGQGTISADGKIRTNVVTRTSADGSALISKTVYERQ